ncbi:MAG: hypothetical protein ACJA0V_004435 [Planctomycetota bacterium]|jgi:hypothetical protein
MPQRVRSSAIGPFAYVAFTCLLVSCGGGGTNSPLASNLPPEMLVCRARVDDGHRYAEVALRTARNLGTGRVGDRIGPERHARLHPDGVRVVFSRERFNDDAGSRELYLSTIDGSIAELRLTVNSDRDDDPVWSPDGSRVLYASQENGPSGLWVCSDTGGDGAPFLPTPSGFEDSQPDWNASTQKIVFSRRDNTGEHVLWLVNGTGFGEMPLTDGGLTAGPDSGDHEPAFSPDGTMVVFVRRVSADVSKLFVCEVATAIVTEVFAPTGYVGQPRYSPMMDRLWFGLAEPDLGRQTLRLAHLPVTGGSATLMWPDERWQLNGIDFLPVAIPTETPASAERLDVRNITMQVAMARNSFGSLPQLSEDDDNEYYLQTAESGNRQIAALNCRFDLPIEEPEDMLEVRVRAIVQSSRIDGDSVFRMSVRNLTDNRYDTVVELTPTSTGEQVMEFRTSSLRHITQERVLQFTVIADLDDGDFADIWVDMIEVVLVPRQGS